MAFADVYFPKAISPQKGRVAQCKAFEWADFSSLLGRRLTYALPAKHPHWSPSYFGSARRDGIWQSFKMEPVIYFFAFLKVLFG